MTTPSASATTPLPASPARVAHDGLTTMPPIPPREAHAFTLALAKAAAKDERLDETAPGVALDQPMIRMQSMQAVPAPVSASLDAAAVEHLDRIAAAIAEARSNSVNSEIHVQLPAGPLPVEAALIGRDAGGQLAVVLIPQNAVPPATAAALAHDLREHLQRREIRARVTAQSPARSAAARSIS